MTADTGPCCHECPAPCRRFSMTGSASFTRSRGACSNPSPGSASTTCTNQSVFYTPYRYFRFTQTLLKSWGCLKSSGTSEYLTRPTGLTAARPTPSPRQPPWSAATGAQEAPTWQPCLCLLSSKSSKSALNIVEIILWHIYSKYVFIWKVLREKVLRGSRLLREHGGPQHHLLWVVRVRVNIWVMCLYIFQLGRFRSSCKWTSIHREDFHSRSTIKGSSWTISRFHVKIVISYNK